MATTEENRNDGNKLLLFDNQSFVVKSLVTNLKLLGWDVTFVSDIDELFLKLNQSHYNILILDVMSTVHNTERFTESEIEEMDGGMNTGSVVAKKIWQMDGYKDTPILFLSGRANPIPRDTVLQNSNCRYMRKPEFAKKVNNELREMLNP